MTSYGFGSNPLASSGFGAANKTFSFGGNTSTGTSAFGSGTAAPAFGTAAATPAFGTTAAPAFGTTAAAPAFGSGATTGFTGFGTGSTTGGGLTFGAPQPTSSSGGFSFGGGTTAPAGGGFSFASTKPTTTSTGFSFGGATNTGFGTGTGFGMSTGTGFGTSAGTGFGASTGTGFGTSTGTGFGTSTGTGFGTSTGTGFGASTGTGFGTSTGTGFGTGTAFGGTNFSSGFGTNTGTAFGAGTNTGFGTGTSTGFGTGSSTGFGTGLNTGFGTGFGSGGGLFSGIKTTQPALTFGLGSNTNNNIFKGFGQPLQQQGGAPCPSVALYLAVCAPAYFNDERDEVLKKWNQLQAVWGTGKGFYAPGLHPVEFSPDNEFCRFKAVGYIAMPTFNAEDGLVELVIGKKEAVVREQQAGLVSELCRLYGGAVQVCVEYVNPGPGDNKTRLCYYVQHRSDNGETKKANTWDVYNHLKSDQYRQVLANLCIEQATPLVSLSESQLKEYLDKPPRGLDALLWEQGKRDNPDPVKYLPVPLVGFQELQTRFRAQETESQLLQGQLDQVAEDVCAVQARQAALTDQLAECHRRQRQMSHRLLQLLVRQECSRKRGVPIGAAEEQLRIRLEALQSQLHAPTQYMGKLNELLSQVSAQGSNSGSSGSAERSALLGDTESDVKEFLAWQQDGISEVVAVLKTDARALQAMLQIRGK